MATSRFWSPPVRFAAAASVVAAAIIALVVFSLRGSTAYYVTPGELAAAHVRPTDHVRVAGRVVPGSIHKEGPTTTFDVSDSSGHPIAFGSTGTGRFIAVVFDVLNLADPLIIRPITAYDVPEPRE